MENTRKILQNQWVLLSVIVLGLAARLAVSTVGWNYDMESWFRVANIVRHGGNVYPITSRYNYGPVWFCVLYVLDLLAHHRYEVLRYMIAGFLSAVDLGIFVLLEQQAGRLAAVLFFLNPVSILVSGYHCQFDNVAILLGLCSVRLLGDDFEKPFDRRKILGLLVLGLSLMTKHLFFAFPFWLAIRQKRIGPMFMVLFTPVVCFFLSLAPFLLMRWDSVVLHVFRYAPLVKISVYDFFLPQEPKYYLGRQLLWGAMLLLFAFVCRKKSSFESLVIYLGVLVAFSPATSNQYLAIPIVLAAVFPNLLFAAYTIISTTFLCGSVDGPHFLKQPQDGYNRAALYVLACAVIWTVARPKFIGWFGRGLPASSLADQSSQGGPSIT